jgi:hydroxyacylglutathione hydrolase
MSIEAAPTVRVVAVDTPSLGDRSYLAHDGQRAFVVDPQRDIDRVLALAAGLGVRITHVFETHLHNDYVTGGLALARATGADYHVNVADRVAFDRSAVADGDVIEVSPWMRVRVLATPGPDRGPATTAHRGDHLPVRPPLGACRRTAGQPGP